VALLLFSVAVETRDVRLVDAVKSGDRATIETLLARKTDVNSSEPDGSTALHWAVHRDDLPTADLLIRSGANVRATNRYGVTPLSIAATNGGAAMIERLLAAGADPNTALPDGETVLMTAARTGKPEAVKTLLAHGAQVNAREPGKAQTALMWAAAENNATVVKVLAEAGSCLLCAVVTSRRRGLCLTWVLMSTPRCPMGPVHCWSR
jgi:ankyrin repeat protein